MGKKALEIKRETALPLVSEMIKSHQSLHFLSLSIRQCIHVLNVYLCMYICTFLVLCLYFMVLYIGNAHEETARQRSKGRSMAKFIHYYTRYKAHGESALLESRYIQTGFDLTAYVRSYLEYRCIY